jgi:hypothetical protein
MIVRTARVLQLHADRWETATGAKELERLATWRSIVHDALSQKLHQAVGVVPIVQIPPRPEACGKETDDINQCEGFHVERSGQWSFDV